MGKQPGGARPAPVRLDDLAAPRFSDRIAEILASVGPLAADLSLRPTVLMDAAAEATGLDDFGDTRFLEPLGLLCDELADDAGLSPMGLVSQHTLFTQLLVNRLLVEHEIARHPEILDLPLEAPIIIAGLPRTGTTHLHNLLAADPRLRSLPYWESLEPVLGDPERVAPDGPPPDPDPRRARTDAALGFVNDAMPHFVRMHEMTTDHVHEEIQLLALDFSTMLFETSVPLPRYRDWFDATDQTETYRYLRRVLQVCTYLRHRDEGAPTRWVLKSPQHLAQFGPLRTVFPDATFVVTHREPVAVTVSMATMVAYSVRLAVEHPDPVAVGAYWSDRVEHLLRACVRDRDLLPADQTLDVRFDEFMADDLAMARRVEDLAGLAPEDAATAAIAEYVATHPRGRHGTIDYDPVAVGIDPQERAAALAFYAARFGVNPLAV
jgi:hypothetical protein